MKKIFTFLFCTALISSAFAQDDRQEWNHRPYDRNSSVYQNDNFGSYQRDRQIEKINHEYDYQVRNIIGDWTLNRWQKRRAIYEINARRAQEINNISVQNYYDR
ncbi:MAG: hypothetical protein ABIY62_08675, partial [Ginsengibacter sp.]